MSVLTFIRSLPFSAMTFGQLTEYCRPIIGAGNGVVLTVGIEVWTIRMLPGGVFARQHWCETDAGGTSTTTRTEWTPIPIRILRALACARETPRGYIA